MRMFGGVFGMRLFGMRNSTVVGFLLCKPGFAANRQPTYRPSTKFCVITPELDEGPDDDRKHRRERSMIIIVPGINNRFVMDYSPRIAPSPLSVAFKFGAGRGARLPTYTLHPLATSYHHPQAADPNGVPYYRLRDVCYPGYGCQSRGNDYRLC